MILNQDMLKRDLNSLFKQSKTILIKDDKAIPCHFNRQTKVFYDDGIALHITALVPNYTQLDLKIGDVVTINDTTYQIYKTELESNILTRLFLKDV